MKEYPLILTTVEGELSLYIPDPEQVKPVYEQNLLEDQRAPFPFWAKVWASSLALTSFLKNNQELVKGKRVLEIGAGIGLPSFTIAQWAATIIISDHVLAAVKLMQKNIEHCRLTNITAMCLDWNHFAEEIKADVVLLSDINYAPEQFESLLLLIKKLLEQGATIIIATPQRIMATPFVKELVPFTKYNEVEIIQESGGSVAISILVLSQP